ALPGAAGVRLQGGIAPTRERGIVRPGREGGGGGGGGVPFAQELCAGGGVGFARLPHASANEALEILVGRHRVRPLVGPRAHAPTAPQTPHPTPPAAGRAVPLGGEIRLDGRLDEPVWRTAPAATDFRQAQPREGQPATQRTEVRFAFDAAAIYVGARMFDDQGA